MQDNVHQALTENGKQEDVLWFIVVGFTNSDQQQQYCVFIFWHVFNASNWLLPQAKPEKYMYWKQF